ncbi:hypothetical protein A3H81_00515 [Candidatus Daviesbacteria bacterium RIFCSPLOWO2_02_FULL_38_18]|nr:MAG: hypothetical protein A3H81_00515 [Candidatus Daviesbacteria bacterium RIFCSPLOWO2_02_FULL_38_18]OGE73011.1 MAG: hypothetical protein A3H18_00400 [Candidatus Daviesbacteria bacterium RIFCSPLOWO2_12_FULL_38_10]HCB23225.1 hypothetical protein [Candidatus Daviesbacteria bacterium]
MKMKLWIFLFLIGLVFFIQFTLLQPIIQYRLFVEDWTMLTGYKYLYPNPFLRFVDVWTGSGGLHTTAQIYYIGILSDFLGYNYRAFHVINVILKGIATLTLFPLVLILFRNKLLAFLTTIFYAISAGSAGPLIMVIKGGEYLAVSALNIFLIVYYYAISKKSIFLVALSSFLFLLTFLLSPSRMFPIFFLVLLVEIFWLVKSGSLKNLKFSLLRLLCFYIPVFLIARSAPVSSCCPFASRPPIILKEILDGNWHNLLVPFAGIGYSLLTTDFWKYFGFIDMATFMDFGKYLFLLFRSSAIFFFVTILISIIISKKPGKFFILVFATNFILDVLMFFVASHHFYIPDKLRSFMDPSFYLITKYPALVALYVFTVSFFAFLEWKKSESNKPLLMALWVGPVFSVAFLWPTWLVIGTLIGYYTSVSWYLIIPPIGLSLFISAVLVLFYEKLKYTSALRSIAILVICAIIFVLYKTSGMEITRAFMGINPQRVKITDQGLLQDKLLAKIGGRYKSGNLFVYFDIENDVKYSKQYYQDALSLDHFEYWMHIRRSDGLGGCVSGISNKDVLRKAVKSSDAKVEFVYKGICMEMDKKEVQKSDDAIVYDVNDFYAYKLENGEFIDIKEQTLKEINP